MEYIIQILKNNWELITAVIIFILSFILQLIKKKPVYDILSWIYEICHDAVLAVENSDLKGSEYKKDACMAVVIKKLGDTFPNLDTKQYLKMISTVIEKFLETPQKHEKDAR